MNRIRRKEENRHRLLDEGVRLLLSQGYHATGLQEILARVGIPKGSFYNYFPSKEAFSAAVIAHYIAPFIDQLDGWLARPELDALTALERYFRSLIDELSANDFKGGCLLGNLMAEIGDSSELCRQALRRALHRYRDRIAAALAQAQREGRVRRDLDARELADILADDWQGALLRMKIERNAEPLERFMTQTFRLLLSPADGRRAAGSPTHQPQGGQHA